MDSDKTFGQRVKEGGTGRRISFTGLLLLCVCFFLPQAEGCDSDFIPVDEIIVSGPQDQPQMDIGVLFTAFLPFTFAFIMAPLYVIRQLVRFGSTRRAMSVLALVLCLLTMLWAAGYTTALFAPDVYSAYLDPEVTDFWTTGRIIDGLVCSVLLLGAISCLLVAWLATPAAKAPLAMFSFGVGAGVYFAAAISRTDARYGLWLSITASILIAIGGAWEAVHAIRRRHAGIC
ncbi:hypothetical protein LCGC14_0205150 [marine sediment metagenome]|uniref:Uncharacterized protein n=1 Tax=marine sediment metagenome TaxID=412755 RepID=A0A0F9UZ41_9ZZZZ|nr:hypothetical protein [Phycisphaerae bacterium]HDZ43323.1 hypothetical protein [Phycisphaerae bacterium]